MNFALPFPLSLLATRGGAIAIVVGAVGLTLFVQHAELVHSRKDASAAHAEANTQRDRADTSEARRNTEHAQASADATAQAQQCAARVQAALAAGGRIRTLTEKPHATDQKTGCPVRALLDADELRRTFQP